MQTTSKVFRTIVALLDKNHITYTLFEHEPVFTSQDAAKIRQTKDTQGAKALLFIADSKPILIVLRGIDKVDTKLFKNTFKIKDLQFATKEEVVSITSVEIGAVPPFGNVMNILTYVDKHLVNEDEIAFNAGAHTKSIKMKMKDFLDVVKPTIGLITKEAA